MHHTVIILFVDRIAFRSSDGRTGSNPGYTLESLLSVLKLFKGQTFEIIRGME